MKKCLFVINPVAGTKMLQSHLDRFIGKLILNTDVNSVDTFFTQGDLDAQNKCASLRDGDYDFIVSVGGDGTVNEVLTGVVQAGLSTPVALIPGGTVNDFANYLKLPAKSKAFAEMINDFRVEPVDVGEINGSCFANVISGGMFSDIAFQVTKEEKNTFGPLAYYATGARLLPQQLAISLDLDIEADDTHIQREASLFMIANSQSVGGFMGITPKASVQDGKLDLFIIRKSNVAELLILLADFARGAHIDNPKIEYMQASHIKISCAQDIIYDIDGEIGKNFPIDVHCLHNAVNLILPKDEKNA